MSAARFSVLGLAALALAAGCASPADEASSEDSAAIIAGAPSNDRRVMLFTWSLDGVSEHCSSVLIAPDALLTAAHCADAPKRATFQATADASVIFGLTGKTKFVAIDRVVQHPEWNAAKPGLGHDVAIAFLRRPITDVTPAEINHFSLPAEWAAANARADHPIFARTVGYGIASDKADPTGSGRRRDGQAPIRDLADQTVLIGDGAGQACLNDSGGPAFVTHDGHEVVISVASFMKTRTCTTGNFGTRLDVNYPFLQATLGTRLGAPLEDAPAGFPLAKP